MRSGAKQRLGAGLGHSVLMAAPFAPAGLAEEGEWVDISSTVQMVVIMAFGMTGVIAISYRGIDVFSACVMGIITALVSGPGGARAPARKDGSMGFDFAGTYTNIVNHKLIEYSFGDRAAQVEFSDSPDGVRVHATFDSDPTHSIEQQRDGWQAILNNFTRHVEGNR